MAAIPIARPCRCRWAGARNSNNKPSLSITLAPFMNMPLPQPDTAANLQANVKAFRCVTFRCPDDVPGADQPGTSSDPTLNRPDDQSYYQWQGLSYSLQRERRDRQREAATCPLPGPSTSNTGSGSIRRGTKGQWVDRPSGEVWVVYDYDAVHGPLGRGLAVRFVQPTVTRLPINPTPLTLLFRLPIPD